MNPKNIKILQTEYFQDYFPWTPEGVKIFQHEWFDYTGFFPDFFRIENEKDTNDWMDSLKEESKIIIPVYQFPTPVINLVINKLREKNKKCEILISGPLAQLQPLNILKYIKADGVLGSEPSISILEDNSRILRGTSSLPSCFFKIDNHNLPNIKDKWIIDENEIKVFPQTFAKCSGKCSFCQIGQNQSLQKFNKNYSMEQIINRIPERYVPKCTIYYASIFESLSLEEIKILFKKIKEKCMCSSIEFWARSHHIVKYEKFLLDLIPENTNIIINVGFESFNAKQLERYNKGKDYSVEVNKKVLEITNNISDNIKIVPLTIPWDPFVTREELFDTFSNLLKINKKSLKCGHTGMIWNGSLLQRILLPYPNTSIIDYIRNNKLLNEKRFNEFDYSLPFNDVNIDFDEFPWFFKEENIKEVYLKMDEWSTIMRWVKSKIGINNKCNFCSGGYNFNRNKTSKEFEKMENLFLEYILGNEKSAKEITNRITNMAEETLNN